MGNTIINYDDLLEIIFEKIPGRNKKDKILIISKLFDLSDQSAYNKLSGRSQFSVSELFTLSSMYGFSIDEITQESKRDRSFIPFYSDGLKYSPRTYAEYLQNINGYFGKIKRLTHVHGYFLANEIPMMHLLNFPHLLYLKMYIWNEVNWQIKGISKEYNPQSIVDEPEFLQQKKYLNDQFCSFHNTEIWNPNMLDNLISQFIYLQEKGIIKDFNQIQTFVQELYKLVDYLSLLAETGDKAINHKNAIYKCDIFYTELVVGSEIILVKSDEGNMLFQQLDSPNYIRTYDANMISKVYDFFKEIKKSSTYITATGERERVKFFENLRQRCTKIHHT